MQLILLNSKERTLNILAEPNGTVALATKLLKFHNVLERLVNNFLFCHRRNPDINNNNNNKHNIIFIKFLCLPYTICCN